MIQRVIAWLTPLGIDVRPERPTGAPLPLTTVRRIGGGEHGIDETALLSISSFGATHAEAIETARAVHRRMRLLPGQKIDGQLVDDVHADELADVSTEKINRFVGTYEVTFRCP